MDRIFNKQLLIVISILFSLTLTVLSQDRVTIAGWTFEKTSGTAKSIVADCGSMQAVSVIKTDGTDGSSNINMIYTSGVSPKEELCGLSSPSGTIAIAADDQNKYIVFKISTIGYYNLHLSFQEKLLGNGYKTYGLSYGYDGTNYKDITTIQGLSSTGNFSYESVDFSKITGLENKEVVYIKIALYNKIVGSGGGNYFDNFNFTAVPASVFCDKTFIGFDNSENGVVTRTFTLSPSIGGSIPPLKLSTSGAFTLSSDGGTTFSNSINTSVSNLITITVRYNPVNIEGMTFNTIKMSGTTFNNNTIALTGSNAPFFENFDTPSSQNQAPGYPMINVDYPTGTWKVARNVMDPVFDRYVGESGVRLRYPLKTSSGVIHDSSNGYSDNGVEMLFDKSNGAGMVNFLYATFGTYPGGGSLKVEYSLDKGKNWKQVSTITHIPVWSGQMYAGTAMINNTGDDNGKIRIRIMKEQSNNNSPINIDNVSITDYVIPTVIANTSSINFGNISIKNSSSFELNLFVKGLESDLNLTSDSPYFTVTPAIISKTSTGNQMVTIQFKPTAAVTYNGRLTLSSSKINQTISLAGNGVNGDKFDAVYEFNDIQTPDQTVSSVSSVNPSISSNIFSLFNAKGLTTNNENYFLGNIDHFYFNTWPSGTSYNANIYYEFSVDGADNHLISLSSLSFDVIINGSANYKVQCSVDEGSFVDMPATFTETSPSITTNGNEFSASGASETDKIIGSKIIFSGVDYSNKNKYTFRFYAHGNEKFGVDNVKLEGITNQNDAPSITLIGVESLATFNQKGVVVTPNSQTIRVNAENLTAPLSVSMYLTDEGFTFSKLSDWNELSGGDITISYNNSDNGEHTTILNIESGDIFQSVNLSGITTPERYTFIGGSSEKPTSWLEEDNWKDNIRPADNDVHSKITIEAPVVLVGLRTISCGEIEIDEAKGGSLKLTNSANIKINNSIIQTGQDRVKSQGLVKIINDELNSGTILFGNGVNPPHATITQKISTMGDGGLGSLYQCISSPVGMISNESIRKHFKGAFLDRFNESEGKWERFGSDGEGWSDQNYIEANRGYSVNFENHQNITFEGYLAAPEDVTYNTTYTASPGGNGYNLIGNPFSGSIDLTTMSSWPGFSSDYDDVVYLWNRAGNYEASTSLIQYGAGVIPMGQAFWVIQKSGKSTANFTIPYSSVGTKNPNQPLMKSLIYDEDHVILNISGDGFSDSFQLYEISSCGNSYDESYDAYKWIGSEYAPQLYSVVDDVMFSIDSRNDISSTSLSFIAGVATMYTITAEYKIGDRELYLVDKKTGYIHNFANGSISFSASKSDDVNRFKLVVGNDPKSVKNNITMPDVRIWGYGKNVYIVGETGNAIIYDIQGRVVAKIIIDGEEKRISIDKPGLYIVKANGITRKIVIM